MNALHSDMRAMASSANTSTGTTSMFFACANSAQRLENDCRFPLGWTTSSGWIAILRVIAGCPAVPIHSETTLRVQGVPVIAACPSIRAHDGRAPAGDYPARPCDDDVKGATDKTTKVRPGRLRLRPKQEP